VIPFWRLYVCEKWNNEFNKRLKWLLYNSIKSSYLNLILETYPYKFKAINSHFHMSDTMIGFVTTKLPETTTIFNLEWTAPNKWIWYLPSIQISRGDGWSCINWFNSITFLCLSQARTYHMWWSFCIFSVLRWDVSLKWMKWHGIVQ
jgi:hypothetical protein